MGTSNSLTQWVKSSLERLAQASLFTLWIGGQPVTASRPRVTKQGWTYYPKPYTNWKKASGPSVDAIDAVPTDKPIGVIIEAVCPRPKTSKFTMPIGDVDNFAKGPMDLLTKAGKVWHDDRQVVLLLSTKRYVEGSEGPGFNIWWCDMEIPNGARSD